MQVGVCVCLPGALESLGCACAEGLALPLKRENEGEGEAAEGMEHSEWAFGVGKQCARARGTELEMTRQGLPMSFGHTFCDRALPS